MSGADGLGAEQDATPICPCPDDECLRPNGPDCQKPLTLEERLALLNDVMSIGPHQMFPASWAGSGEVREQPLGTPFRPRAES